MTQPPSWPSCSSGTQWNELQQYFLQCNTFQSVCCFEFQEGYNGDHVWLPLEWTATNSGPYLVGQYKSDKTEGGKELSACTCRYSLLSLLHVFVSLDPYGLFPFCPSQAQQRECVGSPQGSLEGIISNSHNTGGGLQSRVPSFSNPLFSGSNEDEEDSEASCSGDNLKVHTKIRNKNKSNTSKQLAEPLYEEDVIDGFAIISFSSYDELEVKYCIFPICCFQFWFESILGGCKNSGEDFMSSRSFGTVGYQRQGPSEWRTEREQTQWKSQ